jgi:dTDP-4-amino-4,6-dideoxygalactose transaminase
MLLNAWMHIPMIYGMVTLPLKRKRKGESCREKIAMKRMAKGVSRLYNMALPTMQEQLSQRKTNAQYMLNVWQKLGLGSPVWYGENAFMLIGRHENPEKVVEIFAAHAVEVATHFARAIEWAKEYGYVEGSCPMAERLTKELIMIPTYKKIKL